MKGENMKDDERWKGRRAEKKRNIKQKKRA